MASPFDADDAPDTERVPVPAVIRIPIDVELPVEEPMPDTLPAGAIVHAIEWLGTVDA
jgi:hypothetical protein